MTPGDDVQELKRCAATDDDDDGFMESAGFMENPGVSDLQQKECSSSRHLARAATIIIMSVGALCAANGRSYLQLHMAASRHRRHSHPYLQCRHCRQQHSTWRRANALRRKPSAWWTWSWRM